MSLSLLAIPSDSVTTTALVILPISILDMLLPVPSASIVLFVNVVVEEAVTSPPVAAIVIEPSPGVIVILSPAVSVATAGPDVPPISSSPFASIATAANVSVPESCVIITDLSAKDVAPVPPLATANVADNPAAVPDVF